jgi:restriction-modification enzyme MmeI-like protein
MQTISWNLIQDRASEFVAKWQGETYEKGESQSFWSDFLNIYGIDRKRFGAFFEYAIKKNGGKQGFIDMFWPGKLLAEQKSAGRDLNKANTQAFEYLYNMPDHDLPQAIVVSDFATFQFIDLETREKIEFKLEDLPKHLKLFAFLINEQSRHLAEENPVNRKAAEAMARLHNELRDNNYTGHDLEVLLVRLVFCMFADDAGIFERQIFEDYIYSRTEIDGSDLGPRLVKIFEILNTPPEQRQTTLDEDLAKFVYVNGGLFAEQIRMPDFTYKMREELLAAMRLDWSKVSPAIFGSMFQGVMDAKERRNLGAHYTSEKNILRVIKPLFLDDLYEEFAKVKTGKKRLAEFHDKLASLKFLDPACGCGNFLVITYRELRRLEHKVLESIYGKQTLLTDVTDNIKVNVDQMYGIELEEFPSLIAQTALWLTDHQMNVEASQQFGHHFARLPLTKAATIANKNALTFSWTELIKPSELNYILGNPPFIGQTYQSKEQKAEVAAVFKDIKKTGVLDFVSAWYGKATEMMQANPNIQTALVSTNSITQGEQVSILWGYLLKKGVQINFAHRTFKWTNDAKGVAGVHCVVIGFALKPTKEKHLFEYPEINAEPVEVLAKNINPYLVDAPSLTLANQSQPICEVPKMAWGNKPTDGGNLILSPTEKADAIAREPETTKYIHRYISGGDFLNNLERYCFWLKDADPRDLRKSQIIHERTEKVREFRLESKAQTTREYAVYPTLFRQISQPSSTYLAIPEVSSERRDYIPMAFYEPDVICSNTVQFIAGARLYHFGILTSRMHMAWVRAVCGRLKSDYRYSKDIVYNNFIWPEATDAQKAEVETLAQAVLNARAAHPDATLADLYDPLTMPADLLKAHQTLDRAVDKLYRPQKFEDDPTRVAFLFQKYQGLRQ